jgi:hypothetical protein
MVLAASTTLCDARPLSPAFAQSTTWAAECHRVLLLRSLSGRGDGVGPAVVPCGPVECTSARKSSHLRRAQQARAVERGSRHAKPRQWSDLRQRRASRGARASPLRCTASRCRRPRASRIPSRSKGLSASLPCCGARDSRQTELVADEARGKTPPRRQQHHQCSAQRLQDFQRASVLQSAISLITKLKRAKRMDSKRA